MPALKRSIFRKAAAAAALAVALGAGGVAPAAQAKTEHPPFSCAQTAVECSTGKSTVYVAPGTILRANKYGWAKGTKLEYRWFKNGKVFAGGWNATTKVWGPPVVDSKGDKFVVRVKGTLGNKSSYRFSRTYVVRY